MGHLPGGARQTVKAAEWDEVQRFRILKSFQAMGHENDMRPARSSHTTR
jgi:hypothetical protein